MIRLVLGLWVRVKVMVRCRVMTRVRVSVMDWVRVMVGVRDSVRHSVFTWSKTSEIMRSV